MSGVASGLALKAGTKAAVATLKTGYTKVRDSIAEKRMERMVEQVAARLERDPMGAAEQINAALGTEWGYKLVERTFRELMDSINTRAEVAIAAMMAEYLKNMQGPDRDYQHTGALLRGADEAVLHGTYSVTGELVALLGDGKIADDGDGKDGESNSLTLVRGQGLSSPDDIWMAYVRQGEEGRTLADSQGIASPKNLGIVLRLLERHEFGALPQAIGTVPQTYASERHPAGGATQLHVLAGSEGRWTRLHSYLRSALI